MIRRPPRSTRTDTSFPTRRSSDLLIQRKLIQMIKRLVDARGKEIVKELQIFHARGLTLNIALLLRFMRLPCDHERLQFSKGSRQCGYGHRHLCHSAAIAMEVSALFCPLLASMTAV